MRKYDNSIEDVAGDVTDEYVKDGHLNIPTVDKCSPASCQIFFDVKVHANHAANHANHAESLNPVTVVHKSENRDVNLLGTNRTTLSFLVFLRGRIRCDKYGRQMLQMECQHCDNVRQICYSGSYRAQIETCSG